MKNHVIRNGTQGLEVAARLGADELSELGASFRILQASSRLGADELSELGASFHILQASSRHPRRRRLEAKRKFRRTWSLVTCQFAPC